MAGLYCSMEKKNCIARLEIVLQHRLLEIVLQECAVARIVLQHNKLYCNLGAVAKIVLQHNKLYCKSVK